MSSHRKFAFVVCGAALLALPGLARAETVGSYMGTIFPTAATYCPENTAPTNGQILAIASNQALFSLLGTYYGGDGRTTFGLPDLRGRTLVGAGQGPGLSTKLLGRRGGREQVTLSERQMPTHTHSGSLAAEASVTLHASPNQGSKAIPADGDYLASKKQGLFTYKPYVEASSAPGSNRAELGGVEISGKVPVESVTVSKTGESYPVQLRAPLVTIQYCIVIRGPYPVRPH